MSHAPLIASEAGEYGDTGAGNVHRSTRRFWVAECSCGWHAGSGLGLSWFDTKREAMAAWRGHSGEAERAMTNVRTEKCRDQVGSCICTLTAGHAGPHACTDDCGSSWGENGVPLRFPDHGPHCSATCSAVRSTAEKESEGR